MSTPAMRAIDRYPCRCLCLGLVQMTITVPWRRMTLQLSQRALMEALTFNVSSWFVRGRPRGTVSSLQAVCDPTARQVVGRELYSDAVAGQDPDEVHPELPGDMRQHAVPVFQLDGEHRVGQRLDDRTFHLDRISFRHGRCWVPFSHGMPARAGRHTNAQRIRKARFLATAAHAAEPPAIDRTGNAVTASLKPLSGRSRLSSTSTASSTAAMTRRLMRISPAPAAEDSRDARITEVPTAP